MSTDREMLELAAKAAGIDARWMEDPDWEAEREGMYLNGVRNPDNGRYWNPLTNDGDALRLAVKLCISLDHNRAADQQRYVVAERPGCEGCFDPVCCIEDEFDEQQRPAATRRAIVRAAAEIGRCLPNSSPSKN